MKHGWWSVKKNADHLKCLVFPKEKGMHFEEGDLTDNGEIDIELFNDIIESSLKLKDVDMEYIVEQVKNGFTSGEVFQDD